MYEVEQAAEEAQQFMQATGFLLAEERAEAQKGKHTRRGA